ncbi:MAG: hypothetical protein R3B51_13360 [Thermodesulfobacteriota bacterium]
MIEADVWSIGARSEALAVTGREGHPDDTEQIYDIEIMSHILEDGSNKFSVPYQPKRCGERDLYHERRARRALRTYRYKGEHNPECAVPAGVSILTASLSANGQPVSAKGNCSLAAGNTVNRPTAFAALLVYMLIPALIVIKKLRVKMVYC